MVQINETATRSAKGSNIVRIEQKDGQSLRVGKLLGLQGITWTSVDPVTGQEERTLTKDLFYKAVSSFLAVKQFNERSGYVLPHLPRMLEGCDFYWSYEYRDGQQQSKEATTQLMEAIDAHYEHTRGRGQELEYVVSSTAGDLNATTTTSSGDLLGSAPNSHTTGGSLPEFSFLQQAARYLEPFAVLGSYWSRVSHTLVAVAGSFEIPYISGGSTSTALDGIPYFSRTIPTNSADARAVMHYYKSLGASHLAVLYVKDSWGNSYHLELQQHAAQVNITVAAFGFYPNPDSIESTIQDLKNSQYRYVFAIMWPWEEVVPVAYQHGIIGKPDYFWMAAELKEWVGEDFVVEDRDLALALHGVGTINLYTEPNAAYQHSMAQIFYLESLQQEFMDVFEDPTIFDEFDWPDYNGNPTHIASTVYDAVIALGLTACSPNLDPLFTGEAFQEELLHTKFEGVSGLVEFDKKTGTRVASDVLYSIEYISLLDDKLQTGSGYRFQSNMVVVIQGDNIIPTKHPFIYNSNNITPPSDLPPIQQENLNLVPLWAQVFGCCLGALLAVLSLVCFCWTRQNRHKVQVLIASQPFFLCQLCVGTFVVAFSVFPLSLPGASTIKTSGPGSTGNSTVMLDIACMSGAWLFFVGFSIGFSALASKIYRVNKILALGAVMQRATVHIKNVMRPLYISLALNISMLLCLTLVAPLQYRRVNVDHYDPFGRSLQSYGTCAPSNNKTKPILGALGVANTLGVLLVAYQACKARHFPDDFSDVQSLSLSMLSLIESLLIGLPILVAARNDPTVLYLVASSLVSISCATILLFMFVPKYQMRKRTFDERTLAPAIAKAKRKAQGDFSSNLDDSWWSDRPWMTDQSATLSNHHLVGSGHMSLRRGNRDSATIR